MREVISGIIGSLGTVGLLAFLAWISRAWLLERLRRSIQHEYDVNLERLRGDLRVDAFRNETRFTRLHEKRAQTIADLYAALRKLRSCIADYISDDTFSVEPFASERRETALEALKEVAAVLEPREIFIPAATAKRVRDLVREWKSEIRKFEQTVESAPPEYRGNWATKWHEVSNRMGNELRIVFEELRDEFRQLLGDDSQPDSPARMAHD